MIQGDPGEGKTTPALRLAAACSAGAQLPRAKTHETFSVLYQTAEDGLGDTVKPRLAEAGADESKIFCIDESGRCLSLLDELIESAIVQTGAGLMILDPVQGYLGDKVDMNRANEIRSVPKKVSAILIANRNINDFLVPEVCELTKLLFAIPTHQFLFNPGSCITSAGSYRTAWRTSAEERTARTSTGNYGAGFGIRTRRRESNKVRRTTMPTGYIHFTD